MTEKLRRGLAALSWIVWAGLTCATALVLPGCAGGPRGQNLSTDQVTDSDESDSHKRARLRLELAAAYLQKGQATAALDQVKQAIAADPNWFEVYNLRGMVYLGMGDYQLAEESFKRAVGLSPKSGSVAHNYGWMLCQQSRHAESELWFNKALTDPAYTDKAKTWMAQGLCQMKANRAEEAEKSFLHSYEFDAGNPIVAYNLSLLLFQRGDFVRAQFYVRRLNNSELANAESLWLGIKVERRMENREAAAQLGGQLKKRFPSSRENLAYERGAFNE